MNQSSATFVELQDWLQEKGYSVTNGVLGVIHPQITITYIESPRSPEVYMVVKNVMRGEPLSRSIIRQVEERFGIVTPWSNTK